MYSIQRLTDSRSVFSRMTESEIRVCVHASREVRCFGLSNDQTEKQTEDISRFLYSYYVATLVHRVQIHGVAETVPIRN
jgi:hypothetical protein